MKKMVVFGMLFALSSVALANDSSKVALVKQIYQEAANNSNDSIEVLKKYADSSLKQAFRVNDRVSSQGELCLDFDPVWNSQDPQITRKVAVTELSNGNVQARFMQYGKPTVVNYNIQCSGNRCQITDVEGIKRTMLQCR